MDSDTVAGRLMITGRSAVGFQMSSTALHTSAANSGSVPVNDSGEYSNRMSLSAIISLRSCSHSSAPLVAMCTISSRLMRYTCSRCATDVGLYRCTMACFTPCSAS